MDRQAGLETYDIPYVLNDHCLRHDRIFITKAELQNKRMKAVSLRDEVTYSCET